MAVLRLKEDGVWKEIEALKGSDGHTPEKGVDYFTEEDIASLNIPTKVSDLTNDAGYTTNEGTITSVKMNGNTISTSGEADLGTVITAHQDISGKQDKEAGKGLSENNFSDADKANLDSNTSARHTHTNKSVLDVTTAAYTTVDKANLDYNTAARHTHSNKSTLDGISSSDITNWNNKADASDIPTKTSDLTNDSGFIINTANNLVNYYKKTETFTKQEVNDLISAISTLTLEVVQTLPTQDISTTTIYLVPKTTSQTNDAYDEYIYVSNTWEHIGSTEVDLTNYYTKTQVDGKVNFTVEEQTYTSVQDSLDMIISAFGTALEEKQSQIDDNNKLPSDLVTDTNYTNKFVTSTDKTNWNAKYDKPSGGIPKTDLASAVQTSLGKADTATQPGDLADYIKKDGGSATQTVSLTSGTGTTALGVKSMSTGSYISLSGTGGWLGSYGVSSDKKPVYYNGTGYTLAYTSDIPKIFYGTSATAAGTSAKVVTCATFTASDLVAGTRLSVYFTNANSFNGQATLNVNGTGAKDIYYNGTTTSARYMWVAGETVEFIYNGTQWATINGGLATTTYYGVTKLYTGAASDSQAYASTPRSLYYLANYSIAPYYSSSATYAVGDKVRYSYYLYKCTTAITTAEAWNAEHWEQIAPLQAQIDSNKNYTNIDDKPVLQHRSLTQYDQLESVTLNGTHPVTYYGLPDIVHLQLDETGQEIFDLSTLDYGIFCTSLGGFVEYYGNTVEIVQALILVYDYIIIYDTMGTTYLYPDGTMNTVAMESEITDLESRMYKRPEIATSTAALGTVLLEDNKKFVRNRAAGTNKVTVRFPDTADIDVNWQSWIIVKGSSTFQYALYDANVDAYYIGTDCTNGVFTAQVNKMYTFSYTFDGNGFLCNVVGYAWQ